MFISPKNIFPLTSPKRPICFLCDSRACACLYTSRRRCRSLQIPLSPPRATRLNLRSSTVAFLFYLQNVDAVPLEAVFDNVDVSRPIDRNGLLCNNVFEFAPNAFAIYLTRDLSVDYTFNIDENLPFFTQAWRDLLKMTSQISKEWKTVPTWAKITHMPLRR